MSVAAPRRRQLWAAAIGLGSGFLGLATLNQGWLSPLENLLWDARAIQLARPAPDDVQVALILVDDSSLEILRQRDNGITEREWCWPWPREALAVIADFCQRAGARGLIFDLQLSDENCRQERGDVFAGSRGASLPKIMGVLPTARDSAPAAWPAEITGSRFMLRRSPGAALQRVFEHAAFPVTRVANAAAALGHIHGAEEPVRRVRPVTLFQEHALPILGLAAYGIEYAGGEQVLIHLAAGQLTIGDRQVPLDAEGRAVLRYRKPRTWAPDDAEDAEDDPHPRLYPALSAAGIIESEVRSKASHNRGGPEIYPDAQVDADMLRGRWVIYGVSAKGLHDLHHTPVSATVHGAEIQATVLDNLLEDDFIRQVPLRVTYLAIFAAAFLGSGITFAARRAWHLAAAFAVVPALAAVAGWAGYAHGYWWRVAEPALFGLLALIAAALVSYLVEGRQRRFLEQAFSHYLSPTVVRRLIDDPTRLALGGERRELTMFFSDLEGFSTFSERLDPTELTRLLNDVLSEMTDILMEEEGTLDKYQGDAIVAFWNAPLSQSDHPRRACRAALACQRRLAEIGPRYRRLWGVDLRMRIGIHTGPVVVGNLGSRTRFDYTVIGDAANLASRLEGANKAFGTATMVSRDTWERASGEVAGRELGEIVVVGRETPVRVFEPLALKSEPKSRLLSTSEAALERFRQGQNMEALALFETLAVDPWARTWADRLREIARSRERWDGIWRLTSK